MTLVPARCGALLDPKAMTLSMWGVEEDPRRAGGGTLDATAKGMPVMAESAPAAAVAAEVEAMAAAAAGATAVAEAG